MPEPRRRAPERRSRQARPISRAAITRAEIASRRVRRGPGRVRVLPTPRARPAQRCAKTTDGRRQRRGGASVARRGWSRRSPAERCGTPKRRTVREWQGSWQGPGGQSRRRTGRKGEARGGGVQTRTARGAGVRERGSRPQTPMGVTESPRRQPLREAGARSSSGATQDQHGTRFLVLRHEGEVLQEGGGWSRGEVGEEKGQSLRIHGTES